MHLLVHSRGSMINQKTDGNKETGSAGSRECLLADESIHLYKHQYTDIWLLKFCGDTEAMALTEWFGACLCTYLWFLDNIFCYILCCALYFSGFQT